MSAASSRTRSGRWCGASLAVPPSRLHELSGQYGKLVIAVAGGADKRAAILGAMRGRFANVLVTDEDTADALLSTAG